MGRGGGDALVTRPAEPVENPPEEKRFTVTLHRPRVLAILVASSFAVASCASSTAGSSATTSTVETVATTTTVPETVAPTEPSTTTTTIALPPVGPTTAEDATVIAAGIINAYNVNDLSFVEQALRDGGTWVGIKGEKFSGAADTLAFITPLLVGITHTKILGNPTKVADGWLFPLREFRSGVPFDYFIVVGRNQAGGTVVEELFHAPPPSTPLAACTAPKAGVHTAKLTVGGTTEDVRIFVPASPSGVVLPTVIDWHAAGDNQDTEATVTGYEALAHDQGFIVVHPAHNTPQYSLVPDIDTAAASLETADVAFANALVDELVAHWCADPSRVYMTGYSLGALFTARLVCAMADRIAAAASIDGVFHTPDCTPSRSVPYLAFHGTADPVLPFDGSGPTAEFPADKDFVHREPLEEFGKFVAAAGCDAKPHNSGQSADVIEHDYEHCTDGTVRTFYEVVGGGHTWPGSTTSAHVYGTLPLGPVTSSINATALSWDWFKHYQLP